MKRRSKSRYWSGEVTLHSNAMDLESSVFKKTSARAVARSLQHSAKTSKRRKGTPFQSAMSMLNFYINRAGKNLSPKQKTVLIRAKTELRKAFHKEKAR